MNEVEGLLFTLDAGVATVTLNRPEKLNAITWEMVAGLTGFVNECAFDDAVRAIVITGSGRAFSSGDDIVGGMGERPRRVDLSTERGPHYDMVKAILSAPKPVIAALNGRTHGAGWVIALCVRLPRRAVRHPDRRHPIGEGDLRQPGRGPAASAPDREVAGDGPADDGPGH